MNTPIITFRDIVRLSIIGVAVLLVILYILYQTRFLLVGPQIIITQEPSQKQNERVVTLSGYTHNISHLRLNGRPIFTDPQGKFDADVVLENGYTITTLEAEDRYGRKTRLVKEFVYYPVSFIK